MTKCIIFCAIFLVYATIKFLANYAVSLIILQSSNLIPSFACTLVIDPVCCIRLQIAKKILIPRVSENRKVDMKKLCENKKMHLNFFIKRILQLRVASTRVTRLVMIIIRFQILSYYNLNNK